MSMRTPGFPAWPAVIAALAFGSAAGRAQTPPLARGDAVRFDLHADGDPVVQHVAGEILALRDTAGCVSLQSRGSVPTIMAAFGVRVTPSFRLERRQPGRAGAIRWTPVEGGDLLKAGVTCINGLGEPLGMPMPGS